MQLNNEKLEKYLLISLNIFFVGIVSSISLIEISKFLLFTLLSLWIYKNKKNLPKLGLLEYSLILFASWMTISTLVNFSPISFKRNFVHVFQIALFFAAIILFRFPKFLKTFKIAVIAGSISAVYSIAQYFFGFNFPSTSFLKIPQVGKGFRAFGTMDYPTHNAHALSTMLLYLSHLIGRTLKNRVLVLISFILIGTALFATGNRAVWLGTAISFLIMFLFIFDWKKVLPAILVLSILTYSFMPGKLGNRLRSITQFNSVDFKLRKVIMSAGLMIARDNLVFGVGPDGFFKNYDSKYKVAAIKNSGFSEKTKKWMLGFSDLNRHFHCHNIFIETLLTYGIPGFVLFLVFLFLFFKRAISNISKILSSGIKAYKSIYIISFLVALSLLLQGLLDYTIYGPMGGNIFWLAAGISCVDLSAIQSTSA